MLSRYISSNRLFSILFIVVFMIFATPTPMMEANANEAARTAVHQGMEFYSTKTTVRKQTSASDTFRVMAQFAALFAAVFGLLFAVRRVLTESHLSFHPLIARNLTRLLLSPLKFTSMYV